jgi:hypothetical protein
VDAIRSRASVDRNCPSAGDRWNRPSHPLNDIFTRHRRCQVSDQQLGDNHIVGAPTYLVPNNRSPASPSPGTI